MTTPSLPPALALHKCGPHRYELSGLRTASIRDQIQRGHMLAHGLHMLEDADFRRDLAVLVIGAGATGLEVALTIQKLGQNVVLVEANHEPFQHQRHVNTRVIDPCEYDFPHWTWRLGDMAAIPAPVPNLAFQANTPRTLAMKWDLALKMARAATAVGSATLEFMRDTTFNVADLAAATTPKAEHWTGYADPANPSVRVGRDFAAIVSTVGFASEKTSLPDEDTPTVVCASFWANDHLLKPDLGTGGRAGRGYSKPKARVLISGGGDGASQDVQRVMTGLCGRELFDRLDISIPDNELKDAILAEHEAQRAHIWTWEPSKAVKARSAARWNWHADALLQYQAWHDAYDAMADAVFTSWSGDLTRRLALVRDDVDLTWVVSTDGLAPSYGLNRLLGLLVARLAAEAKDRVLEARSGAQLSRYLALRKAPVILYNTRISAVHPVRPPSSGRPSDRDEHRVECKSTVDHVVNPLGVMDVLVARHGVNVTRLFGGAAIPEQLVPIVLPR